MKFRTYHFLILLKALCLSCLVANSAALRMPVVFVVENGTYDQSYLIVEKNGESVLNQKGKRNIDLRLEEGNEYLLTFSKPGYITKRIRVNTVVPAERSLQGFEPYKIGVNLYKQYEGVNIVVYNQPVAFIRYHAELDEYGYDVDYTKSILSDLKSAEDELAKRAVVERAQGRKSPVSVNKSDTAAEIKTVKETSVPGLPSAVAEEKIKQNHTGKDERHPNSDNPPSGDLRSGSDDPRGGLDSSAVSTNAANQSAGASPPAGAGNSSGEDKIPLGLNRDGDFPQQDNRNESGRERSGFDIPPDAGNSLRPNTETDPIDSVKTIERIIEPNRTITLVRISTGSQVTEFRKINYSWGGQYFFKDQSFSISQHLFELYTGTR